MKPIYILDWNMGANHVDYGMLLPQQQITNKDSINSILIDYSSNETQENEKVALKEKLFLVIDRSKEEVDANSSELAQLLFEEGLDILESKLDSPSFQLLIDNNHSLLFKMMQTRFIDKKSVEIFKQHFPKLYLHLSSQDYSAELPPIFKDTSITRFIKLITYLIQKLNPFNYLKRSSNLLPSYNLDNTLGTIKNRLMETFFTNIVNDEKRPAAICLQEVLSNNQQFLKILTNNNYAVWHPTPGSDTAIAVDLNVFDLSTLTLYSIHDGTTAVLAIDKNTKEEFLFVSVHVPGYRLEFPTDSDDLNNHLTNVEGSLEFGANQYIRGLDNDMQSLKTTHPNAKVVIAGDFNSYPEYFENKKIPDSSGIKTMNMFKKLQDCNYSLFRTNQATELNLRLPDSERELDYFFVSDSLKDRVQIEDLSSLKDELSLVSHDPRDKSKVFFDPMNLPSDHRPIWMKLDRIS